MSYNGSGTFQINTTGQPVVTGTVISSSAFNALTADLATGLSTAITKDGQTATTARIPFAAGINSTLVTDSTSTSTGSIITAGGVGVAKALYVGTTANVAGAATLGSTLTYGGVTLTNAVTGTGKMVLATSPTLVTPALGTPASGILTSCTGVNYDGFKNRIINGAMVIDQRNAGASGTANAYTVDRWSYQPSQASKGTWQQNAGAVTPPTGFSNYLGFTSSSAYSVLTADFFRFFQAIEGLNIADLAWGTASAATVTLSFWVRSSLTGTFGGSITNSAGDRSYPFTYTISAANTWEQKTVTIAGDTTGTWLTTNGIGIRLSFGLGAGATYSGTAGSWAAANYVSATGATSVVGTNGATLYITGVQLERGSTASSFEYRSYGTELALCQRYYSVVSAQGIAYSTTSVTQTQQPIVSMRAAATGTYSGSLRNSSTGASVTATTPIVVVNGVASISLFYAASWSTALTVGMGYDGGSGALITLSAEL